MEKEESIDLQKLMQIIMQYKKVIVAIVGACTLIAMVTAFFILPKTYESTTLVRAKAQNGAGLSAAAGAMLGGGAASSPTMVYTELMKSRAVLDPIIEKVDMEPEVREKMTAKDFAKSSLSINNTKGTDLIEITAKAKSPEEAQMISTEVVNGFLLLMTQLNQNQQSLMVKFLAERIDVAKKEMEDAEAALEKFRQQEKVYVPDQQAKNTIDKMNVLDTKSSELKVAKDSSQVNLQGVNEQLAKQNVALQKFNIADNETVQKIRDSIIDKQINLVETEQRYTDKHPSVVTLKEEIAALNRQLNQEVANSVAAGTSTMNPIHAGLLKQKAELETGLMVNEASLSAVSSLQAKAEQAMSKLSADSLDYIRLQRNVSVTQTVYSTLVKSHEDARIQQAMDSMDIQIVDPAELPKKPVGPKKLLITVVGGVVGMMIAFGYILVLYNRRR